MRPEMIEQIKAAAISKPEHVGVMVGMRCIDGNVPLAFVAGIVGTTQVSVYRWVTGKTKPQNKTDVRKLNRIIYTITHAVERGVLPQEKFSPESVLPIWKESKSEIE